MYWATESVLFTPTFPQVTARDRYRYINKFLHFADNETQDLVGADKLWKLRPVVEHCKQKFKESYQLGENISIDEGTLAWKGRLSFKVYNPQKPSKYGIKSYVLADSNS